MKDKKTKYIIFVVIAIIFLSVGYLLGNFVPFQEISKSGNQTDGQNNSITTNIPNGKGLLEVTVTGPGGEPMVGIETDVAVNPGPPETWGIKEADTNGKTSFELAPGAYYVYFNTNRFPSGYVTPPEQKVNVLEGQTKKVTIVLVKN